MNIRLIRTVAPKHLRFALMYFPYYINNVFTLSTVKSVADDPLKKKPTILKSTANNNIFKIKGNSK